MIGWSESQQKYSVISEDMDSVKLGLVLPPYHLHGLLIFLFYFIFLYDNLLDRLERNPLHVLVTENTNTV